LEDGKEVYRGAKPQASAPRETSLPGLSVPEPDLLITV